MSLVYTIIITLQSEYQCRPLFVHMNTQEYFAFCDRFNNGVYLHHDPTMTDVPKRYSETWKEYVDVFGSAPKNRSIWSEPDWEKLDREDGFDEGYDEYSEEDDMGCG